MAGLLGVIGGMGPGASVYFYDLITRKTKIENEQDHIDLILYLSLIHI